MILIGYFYLDEGNKVEKSQLDQILNLKPIKRLIYIPIYLELSNRPSPTIRGKFDRIYVYKRNKSYLTSYLLLLNWHSIDQ